jgi:hypothetical protein
MQLNLRRLNKQKTVLLLLLLQLLMMMMMMVVVVMKIVISVYTTDSDRHSVAFYDRDREILYSPIGTC